MNTSGHAQMPCDAALRLLSRSLDGDLTRAETRQLYLHLAICESCRVQMAEMAAVAAQLDELNRHYAGQSLDAMVIEQIQRSVRHTEQEPPAQSSPSRVRQAGTRFHVHEVQLFSAQDNVTWTHTQDVLPRDSIRLIVQQGHDHSYHFRLEAWGPVAIVVMHEEAQAVTRPSQPMILQGIRYAFLQTPQAGDAIMIHNEGDQPIHVSAAAYHPDALTVWILRHSSLRSVTESPNLPSREEPPSRR
jgi:anti-sigma factor RsiW